MKFSESWMREWVNPDVDTATMVEQLTMAGLEVDGTEAVAGAFEGVVVGEITAATQHPDADKLRLCEVSDGAETFQVVCGAPNARVGLKAPFAKVGASLPPDENGKVFKIKKAKLRGVESFGMLCAEDELGISDDHDGLMELPADAPVGKPLRDYLNLDDTVVEVDLTPNRGDCFSIKGIARELGVLNRTDVCMPPCAAVAPAIDDVFPVRIEAGEYCPRYVGRIIKGVDVAAATPQWMQERLRRSGLRSIDPIVDVTNYILLEQGQPMHAFDLARLEGGIVVRMAADEEPLALLDGQDVKLRSDTLVIADENKAVAMAGIMGGADSAVSGGTTDILLESAFFAPVKAAGKARSYGLHTDSSHRFERGVDFTLQRDAIERATELLLAIVGGQPGPVFESTADAHIPAIEPINLRAARIGRLLGLTIADDEVEEILRRLGLGVESVEGGWKVTVPSYRFDLRIEADLLEELARIYGYNRLPVTTLGARLSMRPDTESKTDIAALRRQLVARGYREAITYSFIDPELQASFDADLAPVKLANPISADLSVMRTSLLPGLAHAVVHNTKRQQGRVRLFETGLSFRPTESGLEQKSMLAMISYGPRQSESWANSQDGGDFFDLKGDFESLLGLSGATEGFEFRRGSRQGMHPGQTAELFYKGASVGFIGAMHPSLQASLDLAKPAFLLEVELAAVLDSSIPAFSPLSKFPEVRRDLAIIVSRDVESWSILETVRAKAGDYLRNLTLFDVYEGKGIDPKRKSLALGLTFQDLSRTLNDDEVNGIVHELVQTLESEYDATLRN